MAQPDFSKMNLSPEETKNMTRLMKDPKFMNMFVDYAKEIADPKHKQEMEDALRQAESKGEKVLGFPEGKELLIPVAGFCAKTKDQDSNMKVFINICHSNKIRDCVGKERADKSGMDWDIPYSLAPPHTDKDKGGSECIAHDFSVSTKAHQMAVESLRFKKFLVDTAVDAIERQRKVKLCKEFTLPRLKYKGPTGEPRMVTISKTAYKDPPNRTASKRKEASQGSIKDSANCKTQAPILTPKSGSKSTSVDSSPNPLASSRTVPQSAICAPTAPSERHGDSSSNDNDGDTRSQSRAGSHHLSTATNAKQDEGLMAPDAATNTINAPEQQQYGSSRASKSPTLERAKLNVDAAMAVNPSTQAQEVEPKHKVVYRNHLDLAQFWKDKTNLNVVKDEIKEILVHVHLPGVVELSEIELNVTKLEVSVLVRGKYKLQLQLRYEIDEENGHAKFDKEKLLFQLEITLPVRKQHTHLDHDSKSLRM